MRDSFNKYDKSHDGYIQTSEMVKVIIFFIKVDAYIFYEVLLDCHDNPAEVEKDAAKVVEMLDFNKDGSISFVEYAIE